MRAIVLIIFFCTIMNKLDKNEENTLLPDLSNVDEARRAFIAGEIFNRKY